jgi:hypothetical protein
MLISRCLSIYPLVSALPQAHLLPVRSCSRIITPQQPCRSKGCHFIPRHFLRDQIVQARALPHRATDSSISSTIHCITGIHASEDASLFYICRVTVRYSSTTVPRLLRYCCRHTLVLRCGELLRSAWINTDNAPRH